MKNLHDKIVSELLPKFAQRLKDEGIVSKSDRKPFEFSTMDDLPRFQIRPDSVLYLLDGKRVLVEVANPRDPKRFMGEIIYPQILLQKELISAAFFFVLGNKNRTRDQERSLVEKWMLSDIIKSKRPCWVMSWSSEEISYLNLKEFLTNPRFFPKNNGRA